MKNIFIVENIGRNVEMWINYKELTLTNCEKKSKMDGI